MSLLAEQRGDPAQRCLGLAERLQGSCVSTQVPFSLFLVHTRIIGMFNAHLKGSVETEASCVTLVYKDPTVT